MFQKNLFHPLPGTPLHTDSQPASLPLFTADKPPYRHYRDTRRTPLIDLVCPKVWALMYDITGAVRSAPAFGNRGGRIYLSPRTIALVTLN